VFQPDDDGKAIGASASSIQDLSRISNAVTHADASNIDIFDDERPVDLSDNSPLAHFLAALQSTPSTAFHPSSSQPLSQSQSHIREEEKHAVDVDYIGCTDDNARSGLSVNMANLTFEPTSLLHPRSGEGLRSAAESTAKRLLAQSQSYQPISLSPIHSPLSPHVSKPRRVIEASSSQPGVLSLSPTPQLDRRRESSSSVKSSPLTSSSLSLSLLQQRANEALYRIANELTLEQKRTSRHVHDFFEDLQQSDDA
jgi:hypothetical protein